MISIQRILCPTDLTSESDEALRYAVALASAYQAKLFLLYCRDSKSQIGGAKGKAAEIEMDALFTASLAPHLGLNDFCDLDWHGLVADTADDVGKAIVAQAGKQQVDLIVMRSRRRPRAAILLGSTAETVSQTAPCPVLVTHPLEREWVGFSTGEIDLKKVLVAHDFSSDADVALSYGLSLAQEYQTELHLLHVLSKTEQEEPQLAWLQKAESAYTDAASKLQRAVPKEAFLWCRVTNAVSNGKAYQEILDYAKKHKIDLICLGASGSDFGIGPLFGSNVDRVLRQSPCPVLIARPVRPLKAAASPHLAIPDQNAFSKKGERHVHFKNPH